MATLVESYEQQYAVLTAEITAHIGKLKHSTNEDRRPLISSLDNHFEEANDLLEQLEIEIRGTGQSQLMNRLACYRAELSRIKTEYESAKQTSQNGGAGTSNDNGEYYEEWNISQEQKAKLLDNSERLERSGRQLGQGYSVLLETEQIGATVLNDLNHQRETIQRSRNRLRETDEQLGRSSRILSSMIFRSLQQKFVLFAFGGIFILILCVALYFSFN